MTSLWWSRQAASARVLLLVAGSALTLGCVLEDDGPSPPPNHVAAVGGACHACTSSQAVHPCGPRPVGSTMCQDIPVASPGETMLLCGIGVSGSGRIGALRWRSSHPEIAAVTPARLPVTHCVNEISNAHLEAKSPGTATITLEELSGSTVVSRATAPVIVRAP